MEFLRGKIHLKIFKKYLVFYNIMPRTKKTGNKRKRKAISKVQRSVMVKGVHKFKRVLFSSASLAVTNVNQFGAMQFRLNMLPDYTEFTALFDQYRIDKIAVVFMPRGNSSEVGSNNNNCKIFTVLDYDDDSAPASIDALCEYDNLRTGTYSKDHSRSLVPRFSDAIYNSAIATAYGPKTGWLDCSYPAVPHYGLKYACQATAAASNVIFDIKYTYYVSFKAVR